MWLTMCPISSSICFLSVRANVAWRAMVSSEKKTLRGLEGVISRVSRKNNLFDFIPGLIGPCIPNELGLRHLILKDIPLALLRSLPVCHPDWYLTSVKVWFYNCFDCCVPAHTRASDILGLT